MRIGRSTDAQGNINCCPPDWRWICEGESLEKDKKAGSFTSGFFKFDAAG